MFKRVFKLILVGTLIFGITVPSNAAVSVSDGSAFVTKAEFSADLNNLSNRMAQLENSLDAKIDSLVSSYLTRNGIWNGAKQELITNSFTWGNLPSQSVRTDSVTEVNYSSTIFDIFKASKSGLSTIEFEYSNSSTNCWERFYGYAHYDYNKSDSVTNNTASLVLSLDFLDEDRNVCVSFLVGNAQVVPTKVPAKGGYMVHLLLPIPSIPVKCISQFFVDKDKKYSIRFHCFGAFGYNSQAPQLYGGNSVTEILKASVY